MRATPQVKMQSVLSVGVGLLTLVGLTGCSLLVAEEREGGTCGDGELGPLEQCDGSDFGGETCATINSSRPVGTLNCNGTCEIESHLCTTGGSCDNTYCELGEDSSNCPEDCWQSDCEDNTCQRWENGQTCPQDCDPMALCGNGSLEPGEECDGFEMQGEDCFSLGFVQGSLGCVECRFDVSGCDPPAGLMDGGYCEFNADCMGGLCLSGNFAGWVVDGYCSRSCEYDICPGGGYCLADGPAGTDLLCYEPCASPSTCQQNGFACAEYPVDGPTICWPP